MRGSGAWLVLLALLMTACDRGSGAEESRLRVVATTTMIGDLVRSIAGDRVSVTTIIPAGVDPHSFKPATSDLGAVRQADVIFYNGLHLEGKMVELFEKTLADRSVAVTRGIPRERLLPWAEGEGGAYDPHVWHDASLWAYACDTIAGELASRDSVNAPLYRRNAERVRATIEEVDRWAKARLGQIPPEFRVLITSHDAYNYFGRAYGLDVRGLQGISTESEAGLAAINSAVDFVVQRRIPAIFVESSVPPQTIKRVQADARARGVDVKIGGELYSDALGVPGEREGFAVETWEGMMRYNVETIAGALGGKGQP
jgi:manganese/zinc/iron transport system substrate-binding protein